MTLKEILHILFHDWTKWEQPRYFNVAAPCNEQIFMQRRACRICWQIDYRKVMVD